MNAAFLKKKFDSALDYDAYLETDSEKAANWNKIYEQVQLTDEQRRLVAGFARKVKSLCISGICCGECVQQGPLLQRIA